MINNTLLDKYQSEFEKKRNKLELDYMGTGSARTYNSMRKYDDLIQIIRLARQQLNGQCCSCERHSRNVDNAIKKYESYKSADMKDFENFDSFITELKDLRW